MPSLSKFMNHTPMKRNAVALAATMIFVYWSSLKIIKSRNKKFQSSAKNDYSIKLDSDNVTIFKHVFFSPPTILFKIHIFCLKKEKKDKIAVDAKFFR